MSADYIKDKKILLVDDEPELREMVVSILKEDGFRNFETAESVREAVETAEKMNPELAVLDVMLPDGDGFELMKKLKKKGDYPILFLTARGE